MRTLTVNNDRQSIAVVTFDRPASLNSMSPEFCRELISTLADIGADSAIRVVILTGAGRGFSSGHDLDDIDPDAAPLSIAVRLEHQELYANVIRAIRAVPQPVVAAVNGPAAGGGLAMALAADTRVCSTSARFNAAFVRLGISGCDIGVSYLLPRTVGLTLAFEMMLTGRLIEADEALRSGLVLEVVPDGEVVEAAVRVADLICANSPFGVRETKRVMWANLDAPSLESALELENRTQVMCVLTEDSHEAIRAFTQHRSPVFTGN